MKNKIKLISIWIFILTSLFFSWNIRQSFGQNAELTDSPPFGGEFKVPDDICLTDSKRAEIQAKIRENVQKLKSEGKLSEPSSLFLPPTFIFPVRGNGVAVNDYAVHGISNFVDQNMNFPNQLLDYNCGNRTYDLSTGYNHKGVDIVTFPFAWNRMDNNEVIIVAAAAGTIIFKSNGNFDRNCGFNSNNWNAVYVQHADGTVSWYGHMKNNSLTTKPVGATVAQGEFLGVVGSSGSSSAPHLHFEIYNPNNALQDPFQGTCNTLNNFSYWQNQPPYRDSKINKLMTHSAPPDFTTCPNPEIQNEKRVFQPGEQVYTAAYYHDQVSGQQTQYSIIRPDGSTFASWTHTSPDTYTLSYWYWIRTLPTDAPNGIWKFRAVFQSQTYEQTFTVGTAARVKFDYDGDGKSDLSIFRPSVGEWWYLKSSNGGNAAAQFGTSTDKIVPADYTGDGKTDFAIFRPSTGFWYILRSEDSSFYAFPFGNATDVPVPADFDGDQKADSAVFRPSSNTWFINKSTGGTDITTFGATGDKPVIADYDGDFKADIAIFRSAGTNGAEWWIRRSSNQTVFAAQFGATSDNAVPGDYTGDGKSDVAIWRPSTGEWFILRSENSSFYAFPFGVNGDIPVAGDYDGDGKFDAGVFRPTTRNWYIQRSTAGTLIQQFGINGDLPTQNAFVP